ncbi:MAG: peptidoglycan-binding protein, partial [Firmicutes bacterium]|nr:peptidoglycan-binding protein [Bacillota bacterium]
MLLSVTTPSGQRIGLEVDPTDKVEDIKAKIQEKTGCAPCRQSLSYNGKPLKDGDTLLDFIAQGEYSAPEDSAAQDESGAPGDSAAQDETSAFGDLLAQGGSGVPGDFIIQDEYSAPGDFIVREDGAAALSSVRPTVRLGDRGQAVVELQTLLASRGFSPGPADGIFGPLTQNAVLAFQRANGLAADGIVGPITWGVLLGGGGTEPPPPPVRPTLRFGDRGEAVRELQTLLASRGFSPGPADGIFGSMTQNAVMAFQRDRGLAVDGIVGPITWGALLEAG